MMIAKVRKWTLRVSFIMLSFGGCSSGGIENGAADTDSSTARGGPGIFKDLELDRPAGQTLCTTFVEGPPVGISMLQAESPAASLQTAHLASLLAQSCRRNIAMTMLVDGSFGDDPRPLEELVRIATEHGSTLHLYLYLSNGPWQRRSNVPNRGFAPRMKPEEFRRRITSDTGFQEAFKGHVKAIEPLMTYTIARGGAVSLIPMLEDNLDERSARAMEALVAQAVSPDIHFSLGRSACQNCHGGNDGSIAPGTFQDQHITHPTTPVVVHNGLLSNDGASFDFPDEANGAPLSYTDLNNFAYVAAAQNDTFVIWKSEYQGIDASGEFRDPVIRDYVVPTDEHAHLLLEFLRTPRGIGNNASD